MCGIAGIASSRKGAGPCPIAATRVLTDYRRPRGPDAEGLWNADGVVLGHRRLAILDLDARANQPMHTPDGRYSIVFNGEIYNFRELRSSLANDGVTFHTASDTEVLLALFAREGAGMLPRLRGMFALAIWDAPAKELFLARDPYGIKPLYYGRTSHGVAFASQVKALRASGLISTEVEPAGVAGFYLWGSVPEPWTLVRDVFALPAGNSLRVREGVAAEPECWSDIRVNWRGAASRQSAEDTAADVARSLADSVRAHLVADVPVSVFLSGGIDSAAVAGLAAGLGASVEGITIGFGEFRGRHEDEIPAATAIAAHYGLPHFVRRVSRAEFEQDVPRILHAMDQPSIDGVNTWFASKAAAERGYRVVLSGVGGDELFCGYSSFRQLPRAAAVGRALRAVPGVQRIVAASCRHLARRRSQPKLESVPAFMGSLEGHYFLRRGLFTPDELPRLMGVDMARAGLARLEGFPPGAPVTGARDGLSAVGLLESTMYLRNQLLRDSDWASMAHSLELRTPLVDATLLRSIGPSIAHFAGGAGKRMLAAAPANPLPAAIVERPKSGFGLPMAQWLSSATDRLVGAQPHGTSWTRSWARTVVGDLTGCA
jgi:asparagine synthase (glutamine-hydrolysing)